MFGCFPLTDWFEPLYTNMKYVSMGFEKSTPKSICLVSEVPTGVPYPRYTLPAAVAG